MNKHIASAALPFLYRDPFRRQYHAYIKGRQRNKYSLGGIHTIPSRELLYRMLLSRPAIVHSLPTALSLALTPPNNNNKESTFPTTTNSPLDYLAHIRHLSIVVKGSLTLPDWTRSELRDVLTPRLMEYIDSDEFNAILNQLMVKGKVKKKL